MLPHTAANNVQPDLPVNQASNSICAHTSDEPMVIDTSVAFFSHTTPAKLFELQRQKNSQTAFLVNKQSNLMPPRKLFDEYISYLSTTITEVKRIAATLNNPNEEPAERMIKENERKEGFFCTKFRVGHGKNQVDVTLTLPPKKPILLIMGASHCGRMANLYIPNAAETNPTMDTGYFMWQRTGYIRTVADATSLLPLARELMSKVLSSCIDIYGNFCNTGTAVVILPLSWDALNLKISMNDYAANLLELSHILYQFVYAVSWQQRWALCFQFSELPKFH